MGACTGVKNKKERAYDYSLNSKHKANCEDSPSTNHSYKLCVSNIAGSHFTKVFSFNCKEIS